MGHITAKTIEVPAGTLFARIYTVRERCVQHHGEAHARLLELPGDQRPLLSHIIVWQLDRLST